MSLEIIIGCMFSGKTTELIKYHNKYKNIYKTIIINHKTDNRYSTTDVICTHNKETIEAIKLNKLNDLNSKIYKEARCILIDESQFFDDLYDFVLKAIDNGKNIVIAGLNCDSEFVPFANIYKLIPYADHVKFMTAFCSKCKIPTRGFINYRLDRTNKNKFAVGDANDYVVLCRKHYKDMELH